MGAHKRSMPWDVEQVIYEKFLPVESLLSLFWASRAMKTTILRVFRERDTLRINGRDHNAADLELLFGLVAKHCRALSVLHLTLYDEDACFVDCWFASVVANNRASLWVVNIDFARVIAPFLRCFNVASWPCFSSLVSFSARPTESPTRC